MSTQTDIANSVAKSQSTTQAASKAFVENVFDEIKKELVAGNEVSIAGFGKFVPEARPERQGRNPSTGAAITIAASTTVKFKLAKAFKDSL